MPGFSHRVQRLFVVQEGVGARHQLLARGMSPGQIDHARRVMRLLDVHPGVYAVVPVPLLSDDARLMAAILATRGRAVLSHGTAAWRWHLITARPQQIELATRLELLEPRGILIHRTELRAGDLCRNGRFRTTTVARTLLDLAVEYDTEPLVRALAEAEFHHRLRPADVLATLRRGHAGSSRLRAALDLHVPGYGAMRSQLERGFRSLLIAHGVPLPERNQRVGRWTVDCIWRDLLVAVELDGAQHDEGGQSAIDAQRDLWLRRHGWIIRRYSYAQVMARDAEEVVADLLDAFAEARARQAA